MMFLDQPLDYTRTPRASRSPADANPFRGHRRQPSLLVRAAYLIGCLASFAFVGVLLAWRG